MSKTEGQIVYEVVAPIVGIEEQWKELSPTDQGKWDVLAQQIASQLVSWVAETSSLTAENIVVGAEQNVKEDALGDGDDKRRGRKSKLGIRARSGTKEYAKAYYEKNREKMKRRSQRWNEKNRERIAEVRKQREYQVAVEQGQIPEVPGDVAPQERKLADFSEVFPTSVDTTVTVKGEGK